MKVYRVISTSYRSEKVIADDISDAIDKYLLNGKDIKDIDVENTRHKLSTIVKVEYLEDFDYIQ